MPVNSKPDKRLIVLSFELMEEVSSYLSSLVKTKVSGERDRVQIPDSWSPALAADVAWAADVLVRALENKGASICISMYYTVEQE